MKVSIITVTYNSSATLMRTLQSIKMQTYTDIEHIIIDGASADATMLMIRDYAQIQPNVQYISEPDRGIYDAINKGIRMATGDIIGILNSDDCYADSDVVARIVSTFEQTNADIVYGDLQYYRYTAANTSEVVRDWKSGDFCAADIRYGWMPPHPTFYCRRHVYEQLGEYDTNYRISADYEFILRAFSTSYKIAYIPHYLIHMAIGGISNRSLRTMWLKSCEDYRAMRRHHVGGVMTLVCKNLRKIKQFLR